MAVGSTLIFSPNAICRYFSYAGKPGSLKGCETLPVDVEEWLEWEASTLAIAEQSIAEAGKAGSAPSSEVLAAFQYLEERLTGQWLTNTVRGLGDDSLCVTQRSQFLSMWHERQQNDVEGHLQQYIHGGRLAYLYVMRCLLKMPTWRFTLEGPCTCSG